MNLMEPLELLHFTSGNEWRRWLERNHNTASEAWLVHYKKGIKKPGISYREALDEALSFGWIDTKLKSLDKESFMLRWVPRKPGSLWSQHSFPDCPCTNFIRAFGEERHQVKKVI